MCIHSKKEIIWPKNFVFNSLYQNLTEFGFVFHLLQSQKQDQ